MSNLDKTPKDLMPIEQTVIGNKLSELSAEFFYADREKYGNKTIAEILDEITGVISTIKQAAGIDDTGDDCPETCSDCDLDPVSCGHFSIK